MRRAAKMLLWLVLSIAGFGLAGPAFAACPDFSLNGQQGTYSSEQLYSPNRHTLTAGGDIDLSSCTDVPGSGWVTREPDYTFRLTANSRQRRLQFRTSAGCDTVLLVNTPSGEWVFDDDDGDGLNALLDFDRAVEGIYDIWVGTSARANCSATLIAETFNNNNTAATGGKRSE